MIERIRQLLPREEDPYLGSDKPLARKMGALLWLLALTLGGLLLPLSPPNEAIGGAGWVVGWVLFTLGVVSVFGLLSKRFEWSWLQLYGSACFGVAALGVMQWLAGGTGEPYERILLLDLLFVSAVFPLRLIVPFVFFVAFVLAVPFVYDGWNGDDASSSFAGLFVWIALSAVTHLTMRGVRSRRIALQDGEEQARVEARMDEMTGIGNRRAFEEALEGEVARVRRLGSPLSVAMLDVERFKSVNDEFGHLEGDQCLRSIAGALDEELRTPDQCYRWGGDEFALILPGTRDVGAERLGERLRDFVSVRCKRPDGEPLYVRYGAAQLESGMTAEELVSRADLQLGARLTR